MLQGGVSEIDRLKRQAYHEEPGSIRLEVSAKVDDLLASDRVEQPAHEIQDDGIRYEVKKVDKRPLLDSGKSEVEPPHQKRGYEDVGRPHTVYPIDPFPDPRVQDQRNAAEQVNDGETKYHRDEDGQILVRIHAIECQRLIGSTRI